IHSTGLSPRMRGTARESHKADLVPRFIPADAGNGSTRSIKLKAPAVYPRGCGERSRTNGGSITTCGLSPRMRGTVLIISPQPPRHRFIPADAGNGQRLLHKRV